MEQRINIHAIGQNALKAMYGLNGYLMKSSVGQDLLDLVYFRVSQINGCAFCLDMHSKDLRAKGETEQRLYLMDAWREAPLYTEKERAALAWAEAVTKITNGNVPAEVYNTALEHFTEQELIELTMATIAINSYNRINIAFAVKAGDYQPGQYGKH